MEDHNQYPPKIHVWADIMIEKTVGSAFQNENSTGGIFVNLIETTSIWKSNRWRAAIRLISFSLSTELSPPYYA